MQSETNLQMGRKKTKKENVLSFVLMRGEKKEEKLWRFIISDG